MCGFIYDESIIELKSCVDHGCHRYVGRLIKSVGGYAPGSDVSLYCFPGLKKNLMTVDFIEFIHDYCMNAISFQEVIQRNGAVNPFVKIFGVFKTSKAVPKSKRFYGIITELSIVRVFRDGNGDKTTFSNQCAFLFPGFHVQVALNDFDCEDESSGQKWSFSLKEHKDLLSPRFVRSGKISWASECHNIHRVISILADESQRALKSPDRDSMDVFLESCSISVLTVRDVTLSMLESVCSAMEMSSNHLLFQLDKESAAKTSIDSKSEDLGTTKEGKEVEKEEEETKSGDGSIVPHPTYDRSDRKVYSIDEIETFHETFGEKFFSSAYKFEMKQKAQTFVTQVRAIVDCPSSEEEFSLWSDADVCVSPELYPAIIPPLSRALFEYQFKSMLNSMLAKMNVPYYLTKILSRPDTTPDTIGLVYVLRDFCFDEGEGAIWNQIFQSFIDLMTSPDPEEEEEGKAADDFFEFLINEQAKFKHRSPEIIPISQAVKVKSLELKDKMWIPEGEPVMGEEFFQKQSHLCKNFDDILKLFPVIPELQFKPLSKESPSDLSIVFPEISLVSQLAKIESFFFSYHRVVLGIIFANIIDIFDNIEQLMIPDNILEVIKWLYQMRDTDKGCGFFNTLLFARANKDLFLAAPSDSPKVSDMKKRIHLLIFESLSSMGTFAGVEYCLIKPIFQHLMDIFLTIGDSESIMFDIEATTKSGFYVRSLDQTSREGSKTSLTHESSPEQKLKILSQWPACIEEWENFKPILREDGMDDLKLSMCHIDLISDLESLSLSHWLSGNPLSAFQKYTFKEIENSALQLIKATLEVLVEGTVTLSSVPAIDPELIDGLIHAKSLNVLSFIGNDIKNIIEVQDYIFTLLDLLKEYEITPSSALQKDIFDIWSDYTKKGLSLGSLDHFTTDERIEFISAAGYYSSRINSLFLSSLHEQFQGLMIPLELIGGIFGGVPRVDWLDHPSQAISNVFDLLHTARVSLFESISLIDILKYNFQGFLIYNMEPVSDFYGCFEEMTDLIRVLLGFLVYTDEEFVMVARRCWEETSEEEIKIHSSKLGKLSTLKDSIGREYFFFINEKIVRAYSKHLSVLDKKSKQIEKEAQGTLKKIQELGEKEEAGEEEEEEEEEEEAPVYGVSDLSLFGAAGTSMYENRHRTPSAIYASPQLTMSALCFVPFFLFLTKYSIPLINAAIKHMTDDETLVSSWGKSLEAILEWSDLFFKSSDEIGKDFSEVKEALEPIRKLLITSTKDEE
ncbi:hypothetical protein ADUPG1_008203 [Aduncisulcus paluster]|uniref:Uncharacterized protein n=1 Tax=Aduncisulcus paluster TaxID=2918883 RepID=A0ABQ5KR34_9EUKA|nr:hypothetical protein ADUPG1_008203 [Aduncisulcus paluster]